MDYFLETREADALIKLSGRLTFNDHVKMRGLIRELTQNTARRQVFELSGLEFVDSAGIGMLLIAKEELGNNNKDMLLRSASGQVKRVFDVAQIGKLIPIEG